MIRQLLEQLEHYTRMLPGTPWSAHIPLAFDQVDAAVEALLPVEAPPEVTLRRQQLTTGSVRYTLEHEPLGLLGTLRLRKLDERVTELYATGPAHEAAGQPKPPGPHARAHALHDRLLRGFLRRYYDELMALEAGRPNAAEPPSPPSPAEHGWDALFAWFYLHGAPRRMTVDELARAIGYAESTVRHRKSNYDAQHGTSLRRRASKEA